VTTNHKKVGPTRRSLVARLKIQSGKERRSRPERLQVFPLVVAAVVAKLKKKEKREKGELAYLAE
jgi:hypothetical protein